MGCKARSHFELHHFARGDASHCHFRQDALQIADGAELLLYYLAEFRLAEESLHYVQTGIDGFDIFQWKRYPPLEHTRTHGRRRPVDGIDQ